MNDSPYHLYFGLPSWKDVTDMVMQSDLPPQAQRNTCSSLKALSTHLQADDSKASIDLAATFQHLSSTSAGEVGVSDARWRNIKSDVRRALKMAIPDLDTRGCGAIDTPWRAIVAKACTHTDKSALRRFARYCADYQIDPAGVSNDAVDGYREFLGCPGESKSPDRIVNDLVRLWNRIAADHPELSLCPLTVESRSRTYTLPWHEFPTSLQDDVQAFCAPGSIANLFDPERDRRPFSETTAIAYERLIRRLASAEVLAGVPAASLTTLRHVIELTTLQKGLAVIAARNGGKSNKHLHHMTCLCLTIGKHWTKLDAGDLETIAVWAKRFRPTRRGMTDKNRERLRQFNGGDVLNRLVNLPEAVFAMLKGRSVTPTTARLARDALIVAMLTVAPMRLKNLRSLDRSAHFRSAFSLADKRWELVLDASTVKNDIDLAYPIPPHVMDMVDYYMAIYQPILTQVKSSLLFPGRFAGQTMSDTGCRIALSKFMDRQLGVAMNPHLFRHLDAWIFLKSHPGQYESVRQLLGHKNIQTTIDFYASFETDEAMRRFNTILDSNRQVI